MINGPRVIASCYGKERGMLPLGQSFVDWTETTAGMATMRPCPTTTPSSAPDLYEPRKVSMIQSLTGGTSTREL